MFALLRVGQDVIERLSLLTATLDLVVAREELGDLPGLAGVEAPDDLLEGDVVLERGADGRESVLSDLSAGAKEVELLESLVVAQGRTDDEDALAVDTVVGQVEQADLLVDFEGVCQRGGGDLGNVAFGNSYIGHVGVLLQS